MDNYEQLLTELEKLTPGGSEFNNSPSNCLAWIKDRIDFGRKAAKENVMMRKNGQWISIDDQLPPHGTLVLLLSEATEHNKKYINNDWIAVDENTPKDTLFLVAFKDNYDNSTFHEVAKLIFDHIRGYGYVWVNRRNYNATSFRDKAMRYMRLEQSILAIYVATIFLYNGYIV